MNYNEDKFWDKTPNTGMNVVKSDIPNITCQYHSMKGDIYRLFIKRVMGKFKLNKLSNNHNQSKLELKPVYNK